MSQPTKSYGKQSEAIVAQYLRNEGYRICATNYTTRHGEIDIIACDDETYIFVEVKARKRPSFAMSRTITASKQAKIIRTASEYMYRHGCSGYNGRFDVALVAHDTITSYISSAFTADDTIL